jgi:hypothetical protein
MFNMCAGYRYYHHDTAAGISSIATQDNQRMAIHPHSGPCTQSPAQKKYKYIWECVSTCFSDRHKQTAKT